MAITLYMSSFSAPVRSVLLTAEAIGVKLHQKVLDLAKQEHLTPDYLKLNPQHTIPTLDDNGTIICDSHAINAYLVAKYAPNDDLYPKDLVRRAAVDQRLHFDSGAVFPWLRIVSRGVKYRGLTALTADQIEGISAGYDHLEAFLSLSPWVAGDSLTIADFSLISSVSSLNLILPLNQPQYPNIINWFKRAQDLPYYHVNVEGLAQLKTMLNVLVRT